MKLIVKRIFAVLMVMVMLIGIAPLGGLTGLFIKSSAVYHEVGDIVEFGSYPQSEVKDSSTLSVLRSYEDGLNWVSYRYYTGSDDWDGNMKPSDYMWYADETIGGQRYRAVKFSQYRPYLTGYTSSADKSWQDENGYHPDNIYWFKYEPLMWRVLDPNKGLIMCESIIDSQAFSNHVFRDENNVFGKGKGEYLNKSNEYASDWKTSSLSSWLNSDFYNTAFTSSQQNKIKLTELENKSTYKSQYDGKNSYNRVFLLSYWDAINPDYGFNSGQWDYDTAKRAHGTDYAKCQGLYVYRSSYSVNNGISYWQTRTPSASLGNWFVDYSGSFIECAFSPLNSLDNKSSGIRPALKITNLSSLISQSNVYSLNRASGGNDIVITPRSVNAPGKEDGLIGKYFQLTDVTMTAGGTTQTNNAYAPSFTFGTTAQTSEIKLTRADFQDYIIPAQVVSSWKSAIIEQTDKNTTPDYNHTAIMQKDKKDGKPYISTVFIRNKNMDPYQEAVTQPMEITKNKNYDIIMSSVSSGSYKYYLAQDANHKVESTTGFFTDVDLYSEFDLEKKVYAYMTDGRGNYSDFVELNLTKTRESLASPGNFLSNSTFDILGSDFAKITIPKDIPIFGNAEISLNAFKIPAGFTYDGESLKISLGANIFNANHGYDYDSKEYKDWEYNCFKDWKEVVKKEEKKEANGDKQKPMDSYKKAKENFSKKWKNTASISKDKNWDIDFLGYIDMTLVNGQLVVKEASVSLEGSFTFNYTWQGAFWFIPAYAYVEAGASLGGTATGSRYIADSSIPFEWELSVKLEPSLKLGAGIGVKKAASLGLWAKATMPIEFNITRQNLNIAVSGSIGWEGELGPLKASDKIVDDKTLTLVDHYYGTSGKKRIITRKNPISGEEEQHIVTYSVADRDYLDTMSGWLGSSSGRRRAKAAGLADSFRLTNLQTSVYSNAQPRVTAFGDKLLMTWVTDDTSRDEYNRMKLMYSVYDGSVWSEPQAVYDDGKNDNAPAIVSDGTAVYFVWQKITKTLDETDVENIDSMLGSMELYTAKYDSVSGTIANVQRVTNNNCYDYAHDISIINGSPVLYFASCTDNDMLTGSANTISRYAFSGSASTVKSGMNYILSLDSGYANGTETLVYSTDGDGDTATTGDIAVYTYSAGTTAELTNDLNTNPITEVFYGELGGTDTLFATDMSNIYYQQNGETKTVFEQDQHISSNLCYIEDAHKPAFIWTQSTENTNEVYAVYYEDGEWTAPVQVGETETQLASVSAVSYANRIMGTCTSSILTYDEEKERNVPSQTNLSYFTIGDKDDLAVDSIKIDECNIVKGEATEFNVFVTNNGTKTVNSAEFTVTDTLGTEQTFTQNIDLAPGETKMVTLSYTAPSNYTTTELSVTVSSDEITDVNTDNNSTTETIGRPNIVLTESEVHEVDGQYLVTAFVTNESDVDAQNVSVDIFLGDETNFDSTIIVDSLAARETKVIEIVIDSETVSFDENDTCKVFFSSDIDGNDTQTGTKISYVLSKNNDVCTHFMTEVESISPDCTHTGLSRTVCKACGEVLEEIEIPATGHTPSGEWITVKEPDCFDAGLKVQYCTVCGETAEEIEIPANGHTLSEELIIVRNPTCTQAGLKERICTVCGEVFEDVEIPATGHTPSGEWITVKDPTCTEAGLNVQLCTVCGEEALSEDIPAFGHNPSAEWITIREPDCVNSGSSAKLCTICGVPLEYQSIEKIGHNYVDGICTVCGWDEHLKYNIESEMNNSNVSITGYDGNESELIIPSELCGISVTDIGYSAFEGCTGLTSVTIPDCVTSIDNYAFSNCTSLSSVTIPNSVIDIGRRAFKGCTSLSSVTIPNSVTTIGDGLFSGCYGLTNITVDSDNENYCSDSYGVLYNKDKTKLIQYPIGNTLTTFTIPDTVTTIGDSAFEGCTCLTNVTIPESVTSIGNGVFYNCRGLTTFTIPDTVTTIGDSAFEGCTGLTSATIPNSVTSIGYSAFEGCTGLTSVTIPNSVTDIGRWAFEGCTGLTSVTIPESVTSIGSGAFAECYSLTSITVDNRNNHFSNDENGVLFDKEKTKLIQYPLGNPKTSYFIPNSVTDIGSGSMSGIEANYFMLYIPESVINISSIYSDYCKMNIFYPKSKDEWDDRIQYHGPDIFNDERTFFHYNISEEDVLLHMNIETTKDKTCTIDGKIHCSCSCGYSYDITDYSTGHTEGELVRTVQPTCTDNGYSVYRCSVCSEEFFTDWVWATDHTGEAVRIIEPTCTTQGYTLYKCTACGKTYKDDYTSALGHNYQNGTCSRCGNQPAELELNKHIQINITTAGETVYYKFIPESDGTYYFYSDSENNTYGYIYDSEMNELFSNDDYDDANFVVSYDLESGKTYYFAARYYYSGRTGSFSVCVTDEFTSNHNYVFSKTIAPTCLSEGYDLYICSGCGQVHQENYTDSLGGTHNYENGVCTKCDEKQGLTVISDSSAIIDEENKLIYGLEPKLNIDVLFNKYVHCSDDLYYDCNNWYLGTGSVINLYSQDTDELYDTYTIVIFGDVNGDGYYDGQDSFIVNCIANGMLDREQVGAAKWMAADCNHDGEINATDVAILEQAGLLLANVDQTMSQDELMQSDYYMEYLNLIDQNPDAQETPAEEPTQPEEKPMTFFEKLVQVIVKIIEFVQDCFKKVIK